MFFFEIHTIPPRSAFAGPLRSRESEASIQAGRGGMVTLTTGFKKLKHFAPVNPPPTDRSRDRSGLILLALADSKVWTKIIR